MRKVRIINKSGKEEIVELDFASDKNMLTQECEEGFFMAHGRVFKVEDDPWSSSPCTITEFTFVEFVD